jgi:hypothetical protein
MRSILLLLLLFIGLTAFGQEGTQHHFNRDILVDKSTLLGVDYRLFQNTPAWVLAKAVKDEDTTKIRDEVSKNKSLLSFREPVLGQPLLKLAVMNKNYPSVKTLLELGADPNMQDLYDGASPLMEATSIGPGGLGEVTSSESDPRYLELLLKYGGDPNAEETGPKKTGNADRFTPLLLACRWNNLDYVKILVNAGANVKYINEYGQSPLGEAIDSENPLMVIYLIKKGADFRRPMHKTVDGEEKYITDDLRYWRFDLGSDEYKKKMELVDFLKKNGMDYRKTKIPEEFIPDYPKEYLEKY